MLGQVERNFHSSLMIFLFNFNFCLFYSFNCSERTLHTHKDKNVQQNLFHLLKVIGNFWYPYLILQMKISNSYSFSFQQNIVKLQNYDEEYNYIIISATTRSVESILMYGRCSKKTIHSYVNVQQYY